MNIENECHRSLSFSIGYQDLLDYTTLVCGNLNKLKIINSIIYYAKNNGSILYEYINRNMNSYDYSALDLANDLSNIENQIESRMHYGDSCNRNYNYCKKNQLRPLVIMIDNLQEYLSSDDYKSVYTIRQSLIHLMQMAHKTNMYIFIFTSKITESIISAQMHDLFDNILFLDTNHTYKDLVLAFDQYSVDQYIKNYLDSYMEKYNKMRNLSWCTIRFDDLDESYECSGISSKNGFIQITDDSFSTVCTNLKSNYFYSYRNDKIKEIKNIEFYDEKELFGYKPASFNLEYQSQNKKTINIGSAIDRLTEDE